jgi:hypothetical protein
MHKGLIIKVDGTKEVVSFDNDTSYKVLSGAVGGYIQCVYMPNSGLDLWVHEEGKLNGFDQNPIGTALWVDEYGTTDIIVGDIIITCGTDDDGYTLGLSDEQIATLMAYDKQIIYAGGGTWL